MTDALLSTCLMAFTLGARHAFDPDHITIIDGFARRNARDRPLVALSSGALFSLGHGAVVALAAILTALLQTGLQLPGWLETTGWLISITVLLALGAFNLHAALMTPADQPVILVSWKARLLGRGGDHPLAICGTGVLLAFSFDTLAQASLLGIASASLPAQGGIALLVMSYTAGMVATGGVNGVGIAWLARSAARHAAIASRIMAAVIGCVNIAIGAVALATAAFPVFDRWVEQKALLITCCIIVTAIIGYICALLLASGSRTAPES